VAWDNAGRGPQPQTFESVGESIHILQMALCDRLTQKVKGKIITNMNKRNEN
jgi:hypothetical protein